MEKGFEGTLSGDAADCIDTLVLGIAHSDKPVFSLVHIKDSHIPYGLGDTAGAPSALVTWARGASDGTDQVAHDAALMRAMAADPTLRAPLEAAYQSAVLTADAQVGALWAALRSEGLADDAVVAIVGDHGEALGEDGAIGHQGLFVPEVLHVPLVLHLPQNQNAGQQVSNTTSHTDLAITLLSLAGAMIPSQTDGHDLRESRDAPSVATGMGIRGGLRTPMAFLVWHGRAAQVAFRSSKMVEEVGWSRENNVWTKTSDTDATLHATGQQLTARMGPPSSRAPLNPAQHAQVRKDGYW